MCGIIGYVGQQQAQPILLDGLERLEYRGYDSSGIAVMDGENIAVKKSAGRLAQLRALLAGREMNGTCGIGHTRWATHGEPSDRNAHPHRDTSGNIVVVHNGIIENHRALREKLLQEGVVFTSDTDTEVIAHLLAAFDDGDMCRTLRRIQTTLQGSYALCVLSAREPDHLFCMRHDSPLVVGLGKDANCVASDIPAVLGLTQEMLFLAEGDIAVLSQSSVQVYNRLGELQTVKPTHIDWSIEAAEKGGYAHFMLKEIHEEPDALARTLHAYTDVRNGLITGSGFSIEKEHLIRIGRIIMTACGTAYHACLAGKYIIEELVRIPVEVDIASEFRYRNPPISADCLCIALSQSGETADTIAALREAGRQDAATLAVTNVVGSSIARNAEGLVLYTHAGPEIAVASTKAYITQVELLILFAVDAAQKRGLMNHTAAAQMIAMLDELPEKAETALSLEQKISLFAQKHTKVCHAFFIGRGLDYALAMEASLKLKEVSYVYSEAFAAGELKHGTIALIEPGSLVFAAATQPDVLDKLCANLHEVRSRGAQTVVITTESLRNRIASEADELWVIPDVHPLLAPLVAVIPLQLFAYSMAVCRGCDVDKPRNLAKSVTVE